MGSDDSSFGNAFQQNLRRRMRQSLAKKPGENAQPRPSPSPLPQPRIPKYNYLYTKDKRLNLLNMVAMMSKEISSNRDVTLLPEIPVEGAELIGQGATMEVLAMDWEAVAGNGSSRVAVKRVNRDLTPSRDANRPLEHDNLYLTQREAFYTKVKDVMQELRILTREPLCRHRNIVRLLGVSWDCIDGSLFAPQMIVELAWQKAPTLQDYFNSSGLTKSDPAIAQGLISDVADGLYALHFCDVLHADLKPANILLFEDVNDEGTGLVAKIGDFGFADVDRTMGVTDGIVRGCTREWAAPELLRDCPTDVRTLARTVPTAADVYSFGLIVAYIVLDGVDPLQIGGWSLGQLDELKFDDQLTHEINDAISALWENAGKDESDLHVYKAIICETIVCDPTKRPSSLVGVRKRIFGVDPYEKQKSEDRFKIRHLTSSYTLSLGQGSYFRASTNVLTNRVLESLPPKLLSELSEIVGEKLDVFEPALHSLYRDKFRPTRHEPPDAGVEKHGWSLEIIQRYFTIARDTFELAVHMMSEAFILPRAEFDLHITAWHKRPEIFTLIDGNNLEATKDLLRKDPSQAVTSLGTLEGWYPLHLAAALGRVKIAELLLSKPYNVDPNIRSDVSKLTPLHQAVLSENSDIVELLLASGALVNIKYYIPDSPRLRDLTALEIIVEKCATDKRVTEEERKIVAALLRHGSDYLHNSSGRGHSVAIKTILYPELLKVFFDTIPPEDGKRLVNIVDDEGQTMLASAAFQRLVPSVKYLLSKGADPTIRDCSGQTAYAKLRMTRNIFPEGIAKVAGLLINVGHVNNMDTDIREILAAIEETGIPGATAMDDDAHTPQDLDRMEKIFQEKTDPEAAKKKADEAVAMQAEKMRLSMLIIRLLSQSIPWVFKSNPDTWVKTLRKSIAKWEEDRNGGLIPLDQLPDGWNSLLAEGEKLQPGFWNEFVAKEEELPEIVDLLGTTVLAGLEKLLENNGLKVLDALADAFEELMSTRALDIIVEECTHIATGAMKMWSRYDFNIFSKSLLLHRIRKIWRSLGSSEVLDRLHDIAEAAGVHEKIDNIALDLVANPSGPWLIPPPKTNEVLRLSDRYPGTTVFVTGVTQRIPYTRLALDAFQTLLLLLPALLSILGLRIYINMLRGESLLAVAWYWAWLRFWPENWVLIDYDTLQPNPSIWKNLRAASELISFRLTQWPEMEEPLIVSLGNQPSSEIDIPSRLKATPHGRLWTTYFPSLDRNGSLRPIPCYSAMGDLLQKWKTGKMPKRAWCEGWWDLTDGSWTRVDTNCIPTWTEFCKASADIKINLLVKDSMDVYHRFLEAREYFLDTPGEQLQKLQSVFGEEHKDCLEIWQKLFLRDSPPRASRMEWWNSFAVTSFVDLIWFSRDQ